MEKILIAEDDNVSRKLLEMYAKKWGYDVISTENGTQAWEALQKEDAPQIAIIDWMMPGMDGLEICEKVRSLDRLSYTYIILLTAKAAALDVVSGLKSGADDYVTKPFDKAILEARIQVGNRVVQLERVKQEQMNEIANANARMSKDLQAAAHIQMALLPAKVPQVPHYKFSWIYRPSDALGGDMLNLHPLTEDKFEFYVLDVSGHGIHAALLSVSIRQQLLMLTNGTMSHSAPIDPVAVVQYLAEHYADQLSVTGQYFTLLYGILNVKSGICRYVCAGHPGPILVSEKGPKSIEDCPGLPVGLFGKDDYDEVVLELKKDEFLCMYTDGIVEAMNQEKEEYGVERLERTLMECYKNEDCLEQLIKKVQIWSNDPIFDDDITLIGIQHI